jgi:pilus assembly protein CpaE
MTPPPIDLKDRLSIAVLGPNEANRVLIARALEARPGAEAQEYSDYPEISTALPQLLSEHHDVTVIELDSDPDYALQLVENICGQSDLPVMVYSEKTDPDLLLRCMRAGAREFLAVPPTPASVQESLTRITTRRQKVAVPTVRSSKLLVFLGAKGGVGVTSLACNFAVALAEVPNQRTLLIDLDLPLGDAALNLGVASEFSTVTALSAGHRLDYAFLSELIVQHSSGLWILPAPGRFPNYEPSQESIEKLLTVARYEFDYVVVDLGSRLDPQGAKLFRNASTVYLITQASIPELRNANRLISQVFTSDVFNLEIVLNRFESRSLNVSDEHINKALTRPMRWKIPNDHALVRKMQVEGKPLVLTDNPLAEVIREMAESVTGRESAPKKEKKKRFSLFG